MSLVVVVGSYVQDLAFRTSEFPRPGQTVIGNFQAGPGGKGFNQAVACHRQEVSTQFIGAVGADVFSECIRNFAGQEKLPLSLEVIPDVSTAAASIVVNAEGQNQIIVDLGANAFLSSDFVREHLKSAKVVLVQVEGSISAATTALDLGTKLGAVTILNPAPINPAVDAKLLQLADIITPNETEFAFLFKHLLNTELAERYWEISDSELNALCRRLSAKGVIITLGREGCFVSLEDKYYRLPAISVQAVDTTGAGDAFSGGLAAGIIKFNFDLEKALRYASIVAALSTTVKGTAPAMPRVNQVEELFNQ